MAGKHFRAARRRQAKSRLGSRAEGLLVLLAGGLLAGIFVLLGDYIADDDWFTGGPWLRWVLYGAGIWLALLVVGPRLVVLGRAASLERGQLVLRWGLLVRWVDLRRVSLIVANPRLVAIHAVDGVWLVPRKRLACGVDELTRAWRKARAGCPWRPLTCPAKFFPVHLPRGDLAVTAMAWAATAILTASAGGGDLAIWIVGVGAVVLGLWAWRAGRRVEARLTALSVERGQADAPEVWPLEATQWLAWAPVSGGVMVELHGPGSCEPIFCLERDAALLGNMVQRRAPDAPQLDLEEGRVFIPTGFRVSQGDLAWQMRKRLEWHNRRKLLRVPASNSPHLVVSRLVNPFIFLYWWAIEAGLASLWSWLRGRRRARAVEDALLWGQRPTAPWDKPVRALPEDPFEDE